MNNDSFRLYTTPLEYLDFELEISSRSGSQYSIAVMHSPAGEARASMTLPRHRQQLSQHLASLLMWGRDDGQEFGTELFNATIAGEIRGRYYMSKEIAASQDKGLRVKMRIQPTELAALPWELLYDPCEAEFVCLSSNTPIVRYLELPQRIQPLTVALPLQILGMVASPSDQPPLDVESEKQQIEWAIQELRSQGLVELQWSEGQTWRDLQRAMRKGPCHVFHFIGHGGFDRDAAEGFIALASKTGDTDRLSASQLARLLADCRSLRLVFLNSCEGARHSDLEVYSSTASMLVRRGIPAVLAMQNKISNTAAIEFSRAFYEAVADGFPIDAAVAEARKSLSLAMPDTLEWSNSALYMRTPDGVLFQVPRRLSTTRSFVVSKKSAETTLRDELEDTIGLYLSTSFERDQFARLDQAGETDPDRTTLLRQVFVDLEVKSRAGRLPRRLMPMSLFGEHEQTENGLHIAEGEDTSSAMGCFLDEIWPKIVVIGGPGHGKSTLGQYLAQVHRAILLGRHAELVDESLGDLQMQEFIPRTPRVPFRIILKYFAQWLAEDPSVDTLEAYLADQMEKSTSREISPADIQAIMSAYPCLMVLDGLDEVMEGDSRSRLLAQVQEFLSRAEQLGANLQILATSRPTGYSDQFDPEIYWHIELQPMSSDKVSYFANKWARAKIPILEERQRVIDTLKECQQEEHTHLLLATPLQVTIVLLIIKDGGRPPAQREALFHEYWGTIFRREKAKAKGVIRSEESLLFDLHAYLAYLLHRRAAGKDVRSLLPESEFKKTVHRFLRGKDQYSPEEDIVKRSDQMIKEAKDRLVLLVSPEPGLFGFELRSLQEFFAAAYLAQTAKSTHQRFQRLKAIARSEHWRNVALFFAGRIVRSFGGEAANILELVCRPIDRNLPDLYLRRGAWLALEIAADGAFAAHRDLQYGAVEFALTVLRSGLNRRDVERIRAALKRLPMDDHRDIVKPLLKQMVIDLPTFCLIDGLDIYGEVVGPDELFMNGLKSLLPNSQEEHTQAVLDLAVQHRADPKWLAVQLNRYWPMWMKWQRGYNFVRWWEQAHTFVQEVLVEWAPSEEHVRRLLQSSLSNFWRLGRLSGDPIWDLPDQVESFTEQAIAAVQGLPILNMLHMFDISTGEEIGLQKYPGIGLCDVEYRYRKSQASAVLDTVEEKLEKLMSHSALLPQLRAVLWGLYWASHEPTESSVQSFMHDLECLNDDVVPESFFNYTLRKTWPLLGLAVRRQRKGDLAACRRGQSSPQARLMVN